MIVWVDAQLSPGTARWLSSRFAIEATPVRDLGLRESPDWQIFEAARTAGAVVMTKDRDFVEMVERRGPPPQVVWVTVGNTSDQRLRGVLGRDAQRGSDPHVSRPGWRRPLRESLPHQRQGSGDGPCRPAPCRVRRRGPQHGRSRVPEKEGKVGISASRRRYGPGSNP